MTTETTKAEAERPERFEQLSDKDKAAAVAAQLDVEPKGTVDEAGNFRPG